MRGRYVETQSRLVRERGLTDDTGQVAQLPPGRRSTSWSRSPPMCCSVNTGLRLPLFNGHFIW